MVDQLPSLPVKGRGAVSTPVGRYERYTRTATDDGWHARQNQPNTSKSGATSDLDIADLLAEEEWETKLRTTLHIDTSRRVINDIDSPDLMEMRSINPYRGCEHGCIYCFARPSHGYLGYSSGLDFETQILYKPDAPEILQRELATRNYKIRTITLGSNTDCYQPVERGLQLTRRIIEVLSTCNHPLYIITKSALVARDIDLLAPMAAKNLARVHISLTTLDSDLANKLEPRAAAPHRRLATIRALSQAGIPVTVMTAPLIPGLTDMEVEKLLQAAYDAGARQAHYTLVRLPHEVKDLFAEWLHTHRPERAEHVLSLIRQIHGGKLYDAQFGKRRSGSGVFAELMAKRFALAKRRIGYDQDSIPLRSDLFQPPERNRQMVLPF